MSVKITKEIQAAIRQMVEEYGSAVEVERKTQITNSNISKYLSGKLLKMNDSTWQVLEPHLRPFLPGNMPIIHAPRNSGNVVGFNHGTIGPDCLSAVMNKILSAEELSDEEKVKIMKVLQK